VPATTSRLEGVIAMEEKIGTDDHVSGAMDRLKVYCALNGALVKPE